MNQRSLALALSAAAQEILTGQVQRLYWRVDLLADIGPHADNPRDPSNPYKVETMWGSYLQWFRTALDSQPVEVGHRDRPLSRVALLVTHRLASSGVQVTTCWHLPYRLDLTWFCVHPPPVGFWLVFREGPPNIDPKYHNIPSDDRDGDMLPDDFWYSGVPF